MHRSADRPRVGVSHCLLGEEVRYDGGHKRDSFLVSTLARVVEWVPVCPEMEVGMGTPREAIHLVAHDDGVPSGTTRVRLVGVSSAVDWTKAMSAFSRARVRSLAAEELDGYVLKKDSPSCGLERVRVRDGESVTRRGRGLFAEALVNALPELPVEDEGRLHDPRLRENFVEAVFAHLRLRQRFASRWTRGDLVRFHTMHKLQLLAHSRSRYDELGRLAAEVSTVPRREFVSRYRMLFMAALSKPATRGRHADVMLHIVGHFKRLLDAGDRRELVKAIDDYRRGVAAAIVPMTLIRHHLRRHPVAYLSDQTYLDPHPLATSMEVDVAEPGGAGRGLMPGRDE